MPRLGGELRRTLANVGWKAVSLSLEKVCRLVLVVACAPVLGRAAYGRFQFGLTVTTLLALVVDLGLGLWTTRALARDRSQAGTLAGTVLRLRVLAALPYLAAVAAIAAALGPGERSAFLLLGLAALVNAFADHAIAVFRGFERFSDDARLSAARALLVLGAGWGALEMGRSLLALAAGIAAGTVAAGAYGFWIVHRRYELRGGQTLEAPLARQALREAVPLWLASMLSMLYFKGDTVFLRLFAGDAALGVYSAAYKIFEGSMLLPAILLAAAFPPLARAHGDRRRQRPWEGSVLAVLLALGLAVGGTCYLAATLLIKAVFGAAFLPAAALLRVLALGLPLLYVNFGLTHFLIARDLGHKNLVFAGLMLVVNVALNLALIPRWGSAGAAWATVVTEAALTVCCALTLLAPAPLARRPPVPAAASREHRAG